MEHRKPSDVFSRSAQEKAQAAIDHATEVRRRAAEELRKKHAEKTAGERHLIADGNLERRSVCGYPFPADVKPSMSVAFADHLRTAQDRLKPVASRLLSYKMQAVVAFYFFKRWS